MLHDVPLTRAAATISIDLHALPMYEVAGVIAIAVIVAVAAFSRRLGIAAPIFLVLVGVGLSYLPGLPRIRVPSEFVLDVLLPPILYAAAIKLPFVDFRRNLGTILSLSVVLVVVTAFGTGFVLFHVLPALILPAGIALGAVLSPPDAVAATAVGRRLGLPPRILSVLEGEGLVNDATALVLLTTAVGIATGGGVRRSAPDLRGTSSPRSSSPSSSASSSGSSPSPSGPGSRTRCWPRRSRSRCRSSRSHPRWWSTPPVCSPSSSPVSTRGTRTPGRSRSSRGAATGSTGTRSSSCWRTPSSCSSGSRSAPSWRT